MNYYFIFHTTSLVFKSERIIKEYDIEYKMVPTPKVDGNVYCGVCIRVDEDNSKHVEKVLLDNYIEYKVV